MHWALTPMQLDWFTSVYGTTPEFPLMRMRQHLESLLVTMRWCWNLPSQMCWTTGGLANDPNGEGPWWSQWRGSQAAHAWILNSAFSRWVLTLWLYCLIVWTSHALRWECHLIANFGVWDVSRGRRGVLKHPHLSLSMDSRPNCSEVGWDGWLTCAPGSVSDVLGLDFLVWCLR